MTLINQVKQLMGEGVYDPAVLFQKIYHSNRVHYSRVREAIHIAKGL